MAPRTVRGLPCHHSYSHALAILEPVGTGSIAGLTSLLRGPLQTRVLINSLQPVVRRILSNDREQRQDCPAMWPLELTAAKVGFWSFPHLTTCNHTPATCRAERTAYVIFMVEISLISSVSDRSQILAITRRWRGKRLRFTWIRGVRECRHRAMIKI